MHCAKNEAQFRAMFEAAVVGQTQASATTAYLPESIIVL